MRETANTATSLPHNQDEQWTFKSRVQAWPIAALLAVVMVVGFEFGFVYRHRVNLQGMFHSLAEVKRERLESQAYTDEVVLLGDSRFFHARPERIAMALGLPPEAGSNYAWTWAGVECFEAMLRAQLAEGKRPKYVVVHSYPQFIAYKEEFNTARGVQSVRLGLFLFAPFFPTVATLVDQGFYSVGLDRIAYWLTPRSFIHKDGVRRGLAQWLKGEGIPPADPEYMRMRDEYLSRGWCYIVADRNVTTEQAEQLETDTQGFSVHENRAILQSFERFLHLAEANNVQVLMVPIPATATGHQKFTAKGIYRAWQKHVDGWETKYKNFAAVGPPEVSYDNHLMADAVHVNVAGSQQHMDLLDELLREYTRTR